MSALSITRGDDFSAIFTVTDQSAAVNLTGFTVTATVTWIGGSIDATVSTVDLTLGKVRVSLSDVQTAQIPLGRGAEMRFRWTSSGGETRSVRVEIEAKP